MAEDRELFSDAMLEGEYTTWNWLWTRDYGVGASMLGICVDNLGTIYLTITAGNSSWTITRANVSTAIGGHRFQNTLTLGLAQAWSTNRKYVVAMKGTLPLAVAVYRCGAKIASVPWAGYLPVACVLHSIAMSANGRYIAAVFRTVIGGEPRHVALLEGV